MKNQTSLNVAPVEVNVDGTRYWLVLPNADTDYIQGVIAREHRPYEPDLLDDMRTRMQPGDLFVDVGANVGNHALYMACVAGCRVAAFEPNTSLCNAIKASAALNNVDDRVHVRSQGVGRSVAKARFEAELPTNLGAQRLLLDGGDIDVVALDAIELGAPARLLKIDVEGMETEVLDGAVQLLRRDRPIVYVECIRERDFRQVSRRLDALGYCYWETFNATPTHLFLPAESAEVEQRIGRLQSKQVEDEYRLGVLIKDVRNQARQANEHAKQASEREMVLRSSVAELHQDGERHLDTIGTLRTELLGRLEKQDGQLDTIATLRAELLGRLEKQDGQLDTIDTLRTELIARLESQGQQQVGLLEAVRGETLRWQEEVKSLREESEARARSIEQLRRQLANEQARANASAEDVRSRVAAIGQLQSQLALEQRRAAAAGEEAQARAQSIERLERQLSSEQTRAVALADERERLKRSLESLTVRLETAERGRSQVLEKMDRLRAGVTFRLGEAILKALKSPRAFLVLPRTLARIRQDHQARLRATEKAAAAPASVKAIVPAPQAASAPPTGAAAPAALASPTPDVAAFADLRQLRVAFVGAAEMATAFGDACLVVDATPDVAAHVLVVDASALGSARWTGPDGKPARELPALVQACRRRNIPSLLWLHGAGAGDLRHLPWASLVDHLFVADLDVIAAWRQALGHDRVHLLPAGISSSRHNPLQRGEADDGFSEVVIGDHAAQSPSDLPAQALAATARHGVAVCAYSHSLRLMFGRLLVVSDNAGERGRQVARRREDPMTDRRLRVAALRKAHREHDLRERLATIARRLTGAPSLPAGTQEPRVCAVAAPRDQGELDRVIASHRSQLRPAALLLVAAPAGGLDVPPAPDVRRLGSVADSAAVAAEFDFIVPLSGRDYHGPEYLGDLLLGVRWAAGAAITRGPRFRAAPAGGVELDESVPAYRRTAQAALRSSLVPAAWWARHASTSGFSIEAGTIVDHEIVTVDAFDHCLDAGAHGTAAADLAAGVDATVAAGTGGIALAQLESMTPLFARPGDPVEPALAFRPREWLALLPPAPENVGVALEGDRIVIESRQEAGAVRYLYLADSYPAARFGTGDRICCLEGETDGSLLFVLVFFDAHRKKLAHAMHAPGTQAALVLPDGTASVKLALRLQGPGRASLGVLTASAPRPAARPVVGSATHLVVSKQYPDYDDLYRFAFVHSRVRGYVQAGGAVDVLRLRPEPGRRHREFEGVDVTEADLAHLDASLAHGMVDSLLVHFMDPPMWQVVRRHLDKVRVTVWVHGADVQPWWRRAGNYEQAAQRDRARNVTDERLATWRELFALQHPNLKVVFVSRKQADETLCDLGLDPDRPGIEIIHNFIDGDLFAYREKPAAQRLRVLSIRPYASPVYANDLAVQAILLLAQRPVFDQLQFRLVGDGVLWEKTVAPLQGFANVELSRGFITQREIAAMHRDFGVFLVPSRMDSQGVSRDEAMASGLVPVTTRVAAIPEFVDDDCAMLCPPENPQALADAIEVLAANPQRFAAMSRAAAERVRRQSGREQTIGRELAVMARTAESAPALARFDRRIAVYGDLNLNILDGSAIWAASLAETLAGLPRTQVCLLLKARIQRTTVISRLLGLAPGVQIVEPSIGAQHAMKPAEAVQRLVELDAARPFRAFVLRGLDLCTCAAATPQLRGRIWAYLTDVPQSADALDDATRRRIEDIAQASEFLLCQTPQMEAYLQGLFPEVRGRTRLLPPMVPVSADPVSARPAHAALRLCYAGKFAPNWGIAELAEAFGKLRRVAPQAELHVFGDKIHQVPQDPEFQPRTAKWLADTAGLVWHGGVDRDRLMRELRSMDVCWAYRDPRFEHGTLELSTKLLEYASLGVPMVVTRSPVNESVLGAGYPLFVSSAAEAENLLERLARDRSVLELASEWLGSVVSGYSFQAVRDRLMAQGLG